MPRISRSELEIFTKRVHKGELTVAEAIDDITDGGRSTHILAIGTAVSMETHYPMPAMEAHESRNPSSGRPDWDLRLDHEQGGGEPILRAGSIASTAIHAAFGGDINFIEQRLRTGTLLTPPTDFYHGPTYGWEFDPQTRGYILKIHQGHLKATRHLPDTKIIGAVDFVDGEGFGIQIPDEPGHVASYGIHERIGSLPVNMGDVRRNLVAASAIHYFTYPPLSTLSSE